MTTLADMTPEQREQCVGMWCDYESVMGTHQAIYEDSRRAAEAVLFEPGFGYFEYEPAKITPRPDLPRAWQPDGTPVDGHWESEFERIIANGGKTVKTLTSRRFVGEWE